MAYKWKKPRPLRKPKHVALKGIAPDEGLTGFVHGQPATDIEERMYIGFLHNDVDDSDIEYQPSYIAGRNLPGEIRPDFAVRIGLTQLYFADGEYWHKSAEAQERDRANDAILFRKLQGSVEFPIRVPGEDLETQEEADQNIGLALRGIYEPRRR